MVADHVVRPSQTAFMQGRNILDGVVTLHETVHELHSKKLNGVILKLDLKKAYDKVKWFFLHQTLRMKGFSAEWRSLIDSFVSGGSVAIKVNDDVGKYFQTLKGLRQGDPLSPMLRGGAGAQVILMHHLLWYKKIRPTNYYIQAWFMASNIDYMA
jgi:hypothetical protein